MRQSIPLLSLKLTALNDASHLRFILGKAATLRFNLSLLSLLLVLFSCKPKEVPLSLAPIKDAPYKVEAQGELDPIASKKARKGGMFTIWGGPYPKSLNYWLDSWHISGQIMGLLFEPLIGLHATQDRPIGVLAQSWQKNSSRTFTFKIHSNARWNDGKPIHAEDIQFYYDVIMNPKHRTTPVRVILSRFQRPEILDEKTIRITAKKKYWKAFWDAGAFRAFPKHIWEGKDFNRINFDFPVVSGPYKLKEVKRNRYVLLERIGDWWGRTQKYNQHKYNFDYIRYRFMGDRSAALEAFKKNYFDIYPIYTSSLWVRQTNFAAVKKNWVVRQEIYNKEPKSFQGFAINLRKPKFQDIHVRKALCHLLNRKLMNEKLMFNQYFLLNSYFPDLYPNNTNPKVPLCRYQPTKARALLDQAGWKIGAQGIRIKQGKTLSVVFLTAMQDLRHINIYVETLKKAGIAASIEQLSHATVTERVDNFKFDLYWINTSSSRLRDPESLFHSKYADQVSTSNITGLKDKQVDQLLEQLINTHDIKQRNKLLRQLDLRLMVLAPYVLLWQADKSRLLYWNHFGTPRFVLDKFNREDSTIAYWWRDPIKEEKLTVARKANKSLGAEPAKIYYKGK